MTVKCNPNQDPKEFILISFVSLSHFLPSISFQIEILNLSNGIASHFTTTGTTTFPNFLFFFLSWSFFFLVFSFSLPIFFSKSFSFLVTSFPPCFAIVILSGSWSDSKMKRFYSHSSFLPTVFFFLGTSLRRISHSLSLSSSFSLSLLLTGFSYSVRISFSHQRFKSLILFQSLSNDCQIHSLVLPTSVTLFCFHCPSLCHFWSQRKTVFNLYSLSHWLHLVGTKFQLRKSPSFFFFLSLYPDLSVFTSFYFSLFISLSLSLVNPIVTSLSVTWSLITKTVGKKMKHKSGFLSGQTTLSKREENSVKGKRMESKERKNISLPEKLLPHLYPKVFSSNLRISIPFFLSKALSQVPIYFFLFPLEEKLNPEDQTLSSLFFWIPMLSCITKQENPETRESWMLENDVVMEKRGRFSWLSLRIIFQTQLSVFVTFSFQNHFHRPRLLAHFSPSSLSSSSFFSRPTLSFLKFRIPF